MLRADFCEIYEAISQMGFLLSVYTNATMVTNEIMKLFEKYPPHKIGVTMYGACNETYDRLCNCINGYDKFLEGIEKLSALPSLFDIRTTIVQDNLEDLSRMKEFPVQKFGEDKILHISRNVVDKIRGGYAIIHGDEFSCLELSMNRDTINWIRIKSNTGGRYGEIKETYPR